MIFIHK